MKHLQDRIDRLGIQPFDFSRFKELVEASIPISKMLAKGCKTKKQQSLVYSAVKNTVIVMSPVFRYYRESQVLDSLIDNPNLRRSMVNLLFSDGHWLHNNHLFFHRAFDPNQYISMNPRLRSRITAELAFQLLNYQYLTTESVFDLWCIGVRESDDTVKRRAAFHKNASVEIMDAYLSGETVQAIKLKEEGVDEETIETIKDFFWY